MTEEDEINIYPSGRLTKEERDDMPLISDIIESKEGKQFLFLNEHAIPKDKDNIYTNIEVEARLDIKDIHTQAGIDLEGKMPYVFVIPKDKWKMVMTEFHQNPDGLTHGFVAPLGNAVAVMESDNPLLTANAIYHEMMHAVGRGSTIVHSQEYRTQRGYLTKGKQKRGLAVEEGVVDYLAEKFTNTNSSETMKKLREDLVRKWFDNTEPTDEFQRIAAEAELLIHNTQQYILARNIVRKLVDSGGQEMSNLLISSRVKTSKRRQLVDKINTVVGNKQAAKKIFGAQFDVDSLKELTTWMNDQIDIAKTQPRKTN